MKAIDNNWAKHFRIKLFVSGFCWLSLQPNAVSKEYHVR